MTAEKPDQDNFLAMINAKLAALQALAESYQAALSIGALGQVADLDLSALTPAMSGPIRQAGGPGSVDLPVGVFRDKSIPEAIKLYLKAARRKQTVNKIAAGLTEHGLVSTSKSFETTVTGSLHRLKEAGVVLRFKDGWDLAESYPDHLRARIGNEVRSSSKPKAKRKKKTRHSRGKNKAKPEGGLENRVESVLRANDMRVFSPSEVSNILGDTDVRTVRLALARMAKKGKVRKHPEASDSYMALRQSTETLRAV